MGSASVTRGPNDSVASTYLVPCGVLAGLGVALCIARVYTRLRSKAKFHPDDYLMAFGTLIALADYSMAAAAVSFGWGRYSYYLTPSQLEQALKCLFVVVFFWIIAVNSVRLSLACSLLRYYDGGVGRMILWVIITMQILVPIGCIVYLVGQCRPLHSFWKPAETESCWSLRPQIISSWVFASIQVTADLILALMPVKLVWHLRLPLREKILMASLMALGLLATGMACAKMTTFNSFGTGDSLRDNVYPSMLAELEIWIGVIAGCLPSLKAPVERALREWGVLKPASEDNGPSPSKLSFVRPPGVKGERVVLQTVPENVSSSGLAVDLEASRSQSVQSAGVQSGGSDEKGDSSNRANST